MWTCKQVSAALNDGDYMSLSTFRRLLLRMHVAMCIVCGKYNTQVMQFQDGVRSYLARESTGDGGTLAPDVRERLEQFAKRLTSVDVEEDDGRHDGN